MREGPSEQDRRRRARRWVLVVLGVLALYTAATVAVPALRLSLVSADLRIVIETAGLLALWFAAAVVLLPVDDDIPLARNALVAALVTLGLSNACFGIGAAMLIPRATVANGLTFYPWLVARVVAGVLFMISARGSPQFGLGAYLGAALGTVVVGDALLLVFAQQLEEPASTTDNLVFVTLPAILFGWAAWRMWQLFEQGRRQVYVWLAGGLGVAVLAKGHEALHPAVLSSAVTTADVLRSLIGAFILIGVLRMVRQLARERAAAVEAQARDIEAQGELLDRMREFTDREQAFRGIVVHELAAPIAAIRAFTHVLTSRPTETFREQALQGIDTESTRLLELVARMDELRRLELDEFRCELRPTRLQPLLEEAATYVRALPGAHPVIVRCGDVRADVDPVRLGQALRNILTNAARYSRDRAPIVVECTVRNGTAAIAVTDAGPGIPEAERERVLRKHERGSAARKTSGAGLGLHVASRIAAAHGGRLRIGDATPAGGCRVELELGRPP